MRAQLARSGHNLVREGNCLRCTNCRKRSSKGLRPWLRVPCEHPHTPHSLVNAPEPLRKQVSQTQVKDAPALPRIPVHKRRAEVRLQHQELSRRRQLDTAVREKAKRKLEHDLPAYLSGLDVTTTIPPMQLGNGHLLICCGGYVGCLLCGSVSGILADTKLSGDCTRECLEGSKRPIRRLRQGLLPRPLASGSGHTWPSGEFQPCVYRLLPPSSCEDTAAA